MRRHSFRMLAVGTAALLLLAACGGGGDTSDAVVPPAAPAVTTAATPSATASSSAGPSATSGASPSASSSVSAGPSQTSGATSAEGTVIEINLIGGKLEPKLDLNQEFSEGDAVTVQVTTDKAYEIHIHGYDYSLNGRPGEVVTKTFVLDKQGSFAVEVEETGKLLFNFLVR